MLISQSRIVNMKVRIPQEHYDFYRQIYQYLQFTLGAEAECYPDWDFARRLIGNYLDRHCQKSPLTHLLEENGTATYQKTGSTESKTNQKDTINLQKADPSESSVKQNKKTIFPTDHPELNNLHQKISQCQDCFLGYQRKQYVKLPSFPSLPIMVVVDIPSFYDQTQGVYFMDEAGNLLKKMLKSIDLNIKDIYYTGGIKCSSSQEVMNRLGDTLPCQKHFLQEIQLLKPQFILGFGKTTYDLLMLDEVELKNQEFIDSESFAHHTGKMLNFHGIDTVFTYHPRDLLVDSSLKKVTWYHLRKWVQQIKEIKNNYE